MWSKFQVTKTWDFLTGVLNRALGTPEAEMQLSGQHQGSKTQGFKAIAIGAFQFLGEGGGGKGQEGTEQIPSYRGFMPAR